MRIVSPKEMEAIEIESERLGISREQLMNNAGIKIASYIDKICKEKYLKKVVFLCGRGNNGGDCFVAARELVYKDYEISIVNVGGLPKTELAKKNFLSLPKERIKYYFGFQPSSLNNASECDEFSSMMSKIETYDAKSITRNITVSDKIKMKEQERVNIITEIISSSDIIVDGVFGTGFHGELSKEIRAYFEASKQCIKISVDVASGGNSLNGEIAEGTFKADYTLALGFMKTGMTQFPLKEYCGKISIVDIGLSKESINIISSAKIKEMIDDNIVSEMKQHRKSDSHKGDYGHLLIIAGSRNMRGAAVMATTSALRSGVGLVTLASVNECINSPAMQPEAMILPLKSDEDGFIEYDDNIELLKKAIKKSTAILIGCGLGVTLDTAKIVEYIVKNSECPIIIDADGINCIASDINILLRKKTDIIFTPHPKEMSRLSKTITRKVQADRIGIAMEFAQDYNVTVALKGAGTVIANSNGCVINTTGNAGMSKGGSGDVLAGIIASLSAQGYRSFEATCYGVYIHGLSGDIVAKRLGHEAMLPTDIINGLSDSFISIK